MNTRDLSLELQLFTYLRYCQGEHLTAEQIRTAFFGLASQATVSRILTKSPLFVARDGGFSAIDANQSATIKYDFTTSANPANVIFRLSGKEGIIGTGKTLPNAELTGALYLLDVEVRIVDGPPASWKLDIKEINVTGPGFKHKRKLAGNPLQVNGSDHKKYRTLAS